MKISAAAKKKILNSHTSDHRAEDFEKEIKHLTVRMEKEL